MLPKYGTGLTADTLFLFSQVTLVQTARMLETWGVQVEVVGITSAPVASTSTGHRRLVAEPSRLHFGAHAFRRSHPELPATAATFAPRRPEMPHGNRAYPR
ncbi:hypothetical protein [Streptomyces spiralis]|uniref:hypothetical protein n=1 Tax=Streptomyces spiralis TaxID=66376 RepID=UPI0036A982E6